ncbi:MAG: AarF/ABC1/UbiB kinase family protein [Pseudomonadota bacterium]
MTIDRSRPAPRAVPVPAGRVSRLTRLSAMTAGVAGNMAVNGLRQWAGGQRPTTRDLILTPSNIRRIADQLAQMRGAAMKIGQLMSMDTGDALPPELAEILARLRAEADFMPPAQLKRVLAAAWGDGWLKQFARFDVRPIAAASIGQVHRAETKSGRTLAIKVQYPGIYKSIDSDVSNVGALIRMSGLLPAGFDLAPYLDEARRQLREEADYCQEAAYLAEFRSVLAGDDRFVLPEVIGDLTTPTVLAMTFVNGGPIEDVDGADQKTRDHVAHQLIHLVLQELFEFGLMQTDPNFANYRYDPESGRIVLLDFGATRRFSPEVGNHYRALMGAGLAGDREGIEAAAETIGFIAPEMHARHRAAVCEMIAIVFDALRDVDVFDFADPALTRRMNAAGKALAEDGFVPPPLPMDALYLQRKFAGIFLLASRLRARLPVSRVLAEAIAANGPRAAAE